MSPLHIYRDMPDAELVSALEAAFLGRDCRARFLITVEMRRRCGRSQR